MSASAAGGTTAAGLRELEQGVRKYLAWSSIWDDRVTLNLDQFQLRQAETKKKSADASHKKDTSKESPEREL